RPPDSLTARSHQWSAFEWLSPYLRRLKQVARRRLRSAARSGAGSVVSQQEVKQLVWGLAPPRPLVLFPALGLWRSLVCQPGLKPANLLQAVLQVRSSAARRDSPARLRDARVRAQLLLCCRSCAELAESVEWVHQRSAALLAGLRCLAQPPSVS